MGANDEGFADVHSVVRWFGVHVPRLRADGVVAVTVDLEALKAAAGSFADIGMFEYRAQPRKHQTGTVNA
jgi:hypothetical protein